MGALAKLVAATFLEILAIAPGTAQLADLHSIPLPVDAATAADVQRGATILDSSSGHASVVSIDGDRVTIATGKCRIVVPVSALRKHGGGLMLAHDIADLDAVAARRTTPLKMTPKVPLPATFTPLPILK